jgi:hypothetical protein
MYAQFKTDGDLEAAGIVLDYGLFRVTVGRAGGSNKRFERVLEAKTKPFRRAIQTDTMDNKRGAEILREVYAEAVVLNWEVKQEDGSWAQGIEAEDGSLLPFSKDNVLATFNALPDLFADIQEQAGKVALFRAAVREAEGGN